MTLEIEGEGKGTASISDKREEYEVVEALFCRATEFIIKYIGNIMEIPLGSLELIFKRRQRENEEGRW